MANLMPVEIKFAQQLAGNEKKIRFRAVKKLKKYLRVKKGGFTKDDLLRIWKGLHYCMWMQDKALIQEELCMTLTQLVHELSTVEGKMLFVKVFFITEAREWNSIDVWRLDKFMMLVRNMLHESLVVVRKLKWLPQHLDALVQVYSDFMMNPTTDLIPDGLKIHFADIYLDEVEKVGGEQLNGEQLVKLMEPFVQFLQKAKNPVMVQRVLSEVFQPILTRAEAMLTRGVTTETSEDNEEDEQSDIPLNSLQFDCKLLADHLFSVSQSDSVLVRNRPHLYGLVRKFRDVEQGVVHKQHEMVIEKGVTNRDMMLAVNSLVSIDVVKKKGKRKKKHRKNKDTEKVSSEDEEETDANNNPSTDDVPPNVTVVTAEIVQPSSSSKKKGKRKHVEVNGGDEPLTKIKKKGQEEETAGKLGDNKTLKMLKDVFKGKSKKEKKVKNSETENLKKTIPKDSLALKLESDSSEKKGKGKKQKKGKKDKVETPTPNSATSTTTVTALIPDTFNVTSSGTNGSDKTLKGKKLFSESEMNVDNQPKVKTPVSGKKRKAPKIVVTEPNGSEIKATPGGSLKTPQTNSNVKDNARVTPGNDMDEGEIEIWVPNKKYKKGKSSIGGTPQTDFAKFDGSKAPVAYVRRSSLAKGAKTPKTRTTPGSARAMSERAKSVSFNMKKNKAQGFKESLNSPLTPYNPNKQPDQSILKSPGMTPVTSLPKNRRVSINRMATPPSPNSVQVIQKVKAKSQRRASMPVMMIGVAKQPTPMRRSKAADFFL